MRLTAALSSDRAWRSSITCAVAGELKGSHSTDAQSGLNGKVLLGERFFLYQLKLKSLPAHQPECSVLFRKKKTRAFWW